jgi:HTH-type transcriptional regulator/antitoxin HipB
MTLTKEGETSTPRCESRPGPHAEGAVASRHLPCEYFAFMRLAHIVVLFAMQMNRTRQLVTTPAQLGEVLRGRRKARGLSQGELAGKLNLSQSRLSTLESDPAGLTLDRLLVLAGVLGLEIVVQDKERTSERRKTEW